MHKRIVKFISSVAGPALGSMDGLQIEDKLLKMVVFLAFIFSILITVVNFLTLNVSAVSSIGILCSVLYTAIYLVSVLKYRYTVVLYATALSSMTVVVYTWRHLGGVESIAFYILLCASIFYAIVSRGKHVYIVLALTVSVVLGLTIVEYYYPSIIKPHKDSVARLHNISTVVMVVIVFVFFSIRILFNKYLQSERISEHNMMLEDQNSIISSQNRQLTELNRTKDKFFSIISHDLKNPVSAINGLLKVIDDDRYDMSIDEYVTSIASMKISSDDLLNLTENLLNWATIQRGNLVLNKTNINLYDIAAENITFSLTMAARKEITISNDIDANAVVQADRDMASFIIRNLLSNAIKFSNRNGIIELLSSATDGFCTVSVCDKGRGMTKEQMKKLFSIDIPDTTQGSEGEKGSGLGLLLCKEFIDKHSGSISVESEFGKGCRFSFSLPM